VVSDQLLKQWVAANYEPYKIYPVVGDWLRIDLIHNAGGLFGFFQGTAVVFAVVTVGVVCLISWLQLRWGWRSWLITLALGLLLGGAIGNFVDRIRFGYVVDFADIGIGTWRWYVFNIADMAVTCFFLLLIAIWVLAPRLLSGGDGGEEAAPVPSDAGASSDTNVPSDAKGPVAE
jgi:signal peptidase II